MFLGPIHIDDGPWLAPLAAVTNVPYREICLEHGCAAAVTEMVSSEALVRGERQAMSRMTRAPGERVLVVQLFGGSPPIMAQAASIVVERAGADVLDVNMGCPVRKVLNTGAGAALMRDAARAAEIVAAMVRVVGPRVPVTVKMRAGWNDDVNAVDVATRVVDAGASAIVVHGRTREQFHGGDTRWDVITAVKQSVGVPVIGNGGVSTTAQAQAMMAQTGCDAVMVGRGAMGNPWVFSSLRAGRDIIPTLAQRFSVIRRHVNRYAQWFGEQETARQMRKHLVWYLRGMAGSAMIRARLADFCSLADIHTALDAYEQALQRGTARPSVDDFIEPSIGRYGVTPS